jgi:hypothetical protein
VTSKASTALVEGLVNNTAMPTILNISAYKFVALDPLKLILDNLSQDHEEDCQQRIIFNLNATAILLPTDPCLIIPLR